MVRFAGSQDLEYVNPAVLDLSMMRLKQSVRVSPDILPSPLIRGSLSLPSCYLDLFRTPLESLLNWIQEEFRWRSRGIQAGRGQAVIAKQYP